MSVVNLEGVLSGVLLGMIVGVASYTVSRRSLFEKIRRKVKGRSQFFGELIGCHWCLSFWIGLLANSFYFPRPLAMANTALPFWLKESVDFVASWFFIVAVSSFLLSKTFDQHIKLAQTPTDEKKDRVPGTPPEGRVGVTMQKIIGRF